MKYLVCLFVMSAFAFPPVPNSKFTFPHACTILDPDFDGIRYADQVPHCRRNVRSSLKRHVYELYGIPTKERSQYTIDHLVPLSLGGSNSVYNLWPQHKSIYTGNLENSLYHSVKNKKKSVYTAINELLILKYGKNIKWIK